MAVNGGSRTPNLEEHFHLSQKHVQLGVVTTRIRAASLPTPATDTSSRAQTSFSKAGARGLELPTEHAPTRSPRPKYPTCTHAAKHRDQNLHHFHARPRGGASPLFLQHQGKPRPFCSSSSSSSSSSCRRCRRLPVITRWASGLALVQACSHGSLDETLDDVLQPRSRLFRSGAAEAKATEVRRQMEGYSAYGKMWGMRCAKRNRMRAEDLLFIGCSTHTKSKKVKGAKDR